MPRRNPSPPERQRTKFSKWNNGRSCDRFKLRHCRTVMNALPHSPAEHRLRQIALARRAVMDGRPPPRRGALDSGSEFGWIERSWRRCLANGQRPEQRVAFDVIPRAGGTADRGSQSRAAAGRAPGARPARPCDRQHPLLRHPDRRRRRGHRRRRADRPRRPPCPADHPHRRRPVGTRGRHHRHRRGAGRAAAGVAAPRRTFLRRHQRATAAPARRCSARKAIASACWT